MSRWRRFWPFSASARAQIQQNRTHTDRHAVERGHSHPVPPTPYLLMGQRELERGRGVTQSEYVSELDGSGDGACVVGDEILGGAPLGSIRGVSSMAPLSQAWVPIPLMSRTRLAHMAPVVSTRSNSVGCFLVSVRHNSHRLGRQRSPGLWCGQRGGWVGTARQASQSRFPDRRRRARCTLR